MRYFFHYGYYGVYPDPQSWVSTNALIETSEEGYRQIVELEKEIQKRHRELGIPWRGWHRPVKYKRLPMNATMYAKQPWLERLSPTPTHPGPVDGRQCGAVPQPGSQY